MAQGARAADGRRVAFLAGLERGLSAAGAAAAAGIPRSLAYKWRQMNRDFEAAWRMAAEAGADLLEDEALRRVMEGVEKPVFYRGAQVGTVRTYNDRLLMMLLQRRRPMPEPDEGTMRHQTQQSDVFIQELVDALTACDRRIAELTHELNEARRSQAAATPGGAVPEPVPVVLPYDRVDLFGDPDEDEEEAGESPPEAGRETGSAEGTRAHDGTCFAVPFAPLADSPSLPVSNCLKPDASSPAFCPSRGADEEKERKASDTCYASSLPLPSVSNCLKTAASPPGTLSSAGDAL